ncbi:DHS-like NAD/FAD-binding domain-containing protein [Crepidotus variabilis]|uniref:DHS-like NAD/FAD-binding domain-containing protein n=1 Tax=Crepidotus variabilis TaxID=179855 RepID=A0A9P6EIU1_9AGAR|nr:DHS-like NAD/FAD-binding domain-containing protein [Crepidotus variabilis]
MRISVPGLPRAILDAQPVIAVKNIDEAVERVTNFLQGGNVGLITGAGVSVDSGLRAYRGKDGRYMNPNYKPIFYHELVDSSEKGKAFRRRYWLRSFLGYPHVRSTLPNTTHFAFAALQHTSYIPWIITQNVDGLHHKALELGAPSSWNLSRISDRILELHGSIHSVQCSRGHVIARNKFQDWLTRSNPSWHRFANDIARRSQKLRTNPDGDVDIEQLGVSYEDFVVPDCPTCLLAGHRNSVQKPGFVFFGESIPEAVKERALRCVEDCDRLLLAGTTLATYSAFRLLKHALEQRKPVMLLNVGPTRADGLSGIEKIDVATGTILPTIARAVIGRPAEEDLIIREMIQSGIVKPPPED